MDYSIDSAEFAMSYAKQTGNYDKYSIFGICVCVLFFVKYMAKALCTVPTSPEMG